MDSVECAHFPEVKNMNFYLNWTSAPKVIDVLSSVKSMPSLFIIIQLPFVLVAFQQHVFCNSSVHTSTNCNVTEHMMSKTTASLIEFKM